MDFFRRVTAAFHQRRKWHLHELSDWVLAPLGAVSFLIAGYWVMVVTDVLPGLVTLTNQHGLTWSGAAAFAFLGGLGVKTWLFSLVACRCNSLLVERHPF
ncbi:TPA: hypothetical protein ACRMUA_003701 [Pseudomonas aeruginosa]|uniref:hypothetical protein n=1 Tax=Pseudomonas aeruginosa TaxID=287 RepID=UPI0028E0278B|nr:hypothetical protein [Pseudomonas aeruginosa]ELQ7352079.1 hypothetical protein [Pseudomonas aeruginosa]ELQ7353833.1 hypothetical protein [Pseudomonas aeruginosa]HCF7197886.1 hypothetical protein [Pseudomonas aeruginosa]HCF7198674.1 hypothetical protein [Pseudomonas aeruginosa]